MIVWYILLVILILVGITEWSTFRTGVPTLASFPPSRRKMIEVLEKEFAGRSIEIIDLGSGNGQLATKIARALPNAQVTGIEISIVPWFISYLRRMVMGPSNVKFRRVNFFPFDCSKTDAVVVYLTGKVMEPVSAKLRKELKPGAIVLTNEIPLQGDWQPVEVIETGFLNMKIYVYRQDK